jgi:GDSL-like Lipase/Acylhydrolase family
MPAGPREGNMSLLNHRRLRAVALLLFAFASCEQGSSEPPQVEAYAQAETACQFQQGQGLMCGAGGDPKMLYGSWNGVLTPLVYCANGCDVLPARGGVRQDECRGLSDRPTVLIQAGHENISQNCRDKLSGSQALGATNEAQWTADVAERVVNKLARDDYNAFHVDANFNCSPLAARHYDAAVSIHYRGLGELGPLGPGMAGPLNRGYFVSAVSPEFDEAASESQRLVQNINDAYAAAGIISPAPPGTPLGNVPQYYLKNNDLLDNPDKCGFVLSRTTPFALLEAGVGAPDGADYDAIWSRQDEIAESIVQGIELFLVGKRETRTPRNVLTRPPHQGPPRIMLVGDSITHGKTGDYTWRYRLHEHLRSSGAPFDFVGPFRGPMDPSVPDDVRHQGTYAPEANWNWDDEHDATWGRLLWNEVDVIQDYVRLHQPDLMVVHLGTNDLNPVFGGGSPVGVADNMRRLIRNARGGNPDLDIVLVQIPQTGPIENSGPQAAQYIPQYAANLEWVARTDDRPMSHIQVANVFGNYNWRTDNYDETHPNQRGEHLTAREVANTLWNDWFYGGTYGPVPPAAGPPQVQNIRIDPPSISRAARFTVSWDRVVNPGIWTPYKVQVRYHKAFGFGLVWESQETPDLSVTYDGPPLPQSGVYHIVVVSTDGTNETPSEPVPLEVTDGPPAPTDVRVDPPVVARNQPFTVTWPRVVNPGVWTPYKVQVRYHANFGFGLVWESPVTPDLSVTYDGPQLPQAGVYHVVVISTDGTYDSMSLPVPLEVHDPPRPTGVAVSPSSVVFDQPFTVSWPRVVNPGVWTTYKVQVRYHQNFGFGLIWESAETPDLSVTYSGPTLPIEGVYAIVVVSTDGTNSSMSEPVPLELHHAGPPRPTDVVVDPPSITANQPFTVSWPRVVNPGVWTTYKVQVRYHQNFGFGLVWESPETPDLSVTYDGPPLPQAGTYAIVVVATDGTNNSPSDPMPLVVSSP